MGAGEEEVEVESGGVWNLPWPSVLKPGLCNQHTSRSGPHCEMWRILDFEEERGGESLDD